MQLPTALDECDLMGGVWSAPAPITSINDSRSMGNKTNKAKRKITSASVSRVCFEPNSVNRTSEKSANAVTRTSEESANSVKSTSLKSLLWLEGSGETIWLEASGGPQESAMADEPRESAKADKSLKANEPQESAKADESGRKTLIDPNDL